MSWRIVVISKRAKLDLQLGYMVVRGEELHKVHLSEMAVLLIENCAVSLTAALLAELVRQKIKVIFCDEKHNPSSELVPYYGSFETSNRVRIQINWSDEAKWCVWREIVRNKVYNQAMVLKRFKLKEEALLQEYINSIGINDTSNREGHAAKVYFNALFGKRFYRDDESAINSALDYGYTVLLSACNREVVSNGYITQLGIHHCNVHNQFNLGCDLMEGFRPVLDLLVCNMLKDGLLEVFESKEKISVLDILSQILMIDGKKYSLDDAIRIYIHNVFEALRYNDMERIKPCYIIGDVDEL